LDPTGNAPDGAVHVVVTGGVPPPVWGGAYETSTGCPSGDSTSIAAGHAIVSVGGGGGGGGAIGVLPQRSETSAAHAASAARASRDV
jgi:hypothetical protein